MEAIFGIEEILGVCNCDEASDQAAVLWFHLRLMAREIVPTRTLLFLEIIIAAKGFNGLLSEIIVNCPANLISCY